jgi:hypothetical protein
LKRFNLTITVSGSIIILDNYVVMSQRLSAGLREVQSKEKGNAMPQDGEQSQLRRRRSDTRSGDYYPVTGGQETPLPQTGPPYADIDDGVDYPRPNTSAVRYTGPYNTPTQRSSAMASSSSSRRQQPIIKNPTTPQQRSARTTTTQQQKEAKPKTKRNIHWLFYIGVGMLATLVLWMAGSTALAWVLQVRDNVTYGYPRTYQTDAVVGHNDSPQKPSHFIAMNLNRQAVVVEFMGGDPSKAVTYVAPIYIAGNGGDMAPVTLEFRDVTGDGKPDMIVHIHLPSQDQISVFVNDSTKFRPVNGNDKIRV